MDGTDAGADTTGNMAERKSLLDVVLEKLNVDAENRQLLSRVLLAGPLTTGESSKGFFEALMNEGGAAGAVANSRYTGVLIETGQNFVHLLEAPTDDVLRYMAEMGKKKDEFDAVGDVVVASYTDDIGSRAHTRWIVLTQQTNGSSGNMNRAELKELIVNMTCNLMELGSMMSNKKDLQMQHFLPVLKNTHPDILPTTSQIERCYASPGCDYCLTLDEFTDVYCA
eukprot:gene19202-29565_t